MSLIKHYKYFFFEITKKNKQIRLIYSSGNKNKIQHLGYKT